MLTTDDILSSRDIRLYSDDLLCVISEEEHAAYWYSKRGLPWESRENDSFLRHQNYTPADGIHISGKEALQVIKTWLIKLK